MQEEGKSMCEPILNANDIANRNSSRFRLLTIESVGDTQVLVRCVHDVEQASKQTGNN